MATKGINPLDPRNVLQANVSRRALLQRAVVLGLSVPTGVALLSACGEDDDELDEPAADPDPDMDEDDDEPPLEEDDEEVEVEEDDDEDEEEDEPLEDDDDEALAEDDDEEYPRGGHLDVTYAGAGQPAHLDTQLTAAGLARFASDPINDWLTWYDQDYELVPSLATTIDIVDDVTVSFTLREGVQFHNGRALTSDDVRQNIERVLDPENASPFAAVLEPVEEVETPDELTAVFHLNRVYPGLLGNLTRIPILPLEEEENMRTNPVGCGPFRFAEWRDDSHIDYERFQDYWDPDLPRLDSIRWLFRPDYASAKASFEAGEVDLLFYLSLVDVAPFEAMEHQGIHVRAEETLGFSYLAMNHEREPYDDVRVRQAVQLAIDPEPFNQIAYAGLSVPHRIPIARGTPFYFDDFEFGPDLDRARELLVEAGYPDGFEDEVLIPNTSFEAPYGEIIQNQLAEIGIELSILLMEPGPFVERTLQEKDYNICMLGDSPLPDPSFLLDRYVKSDGGSNLFNYNNPEMDELLDQASSTYDIDERVEYYKQAMALLIDDAVWQIFLQRAKADTWYDTVAYDRFWSPTGNRYQWGWLARRG